ncbi:MAG: hypothetical protein LN408_01130 [Candidatus Thermoplasmatota archaeon]|nr:hypothetical protein [Candidatus Thermoplasmatota archaeon]MCK5300804.1 hypothetical protein [Thermoplasmatales archaeon]
MLVNTSSAVEYKTVIDYNINILESKLDKINNLIEKIRQTIEGIKINSINLESKNAVEDLSDELADLRISILDNPSLPTFIRTILGFIIGLLFSIIGTIFGIIFGPLLALFLRILTAPLVLFAKIIAFIVNLFTS